MRDDDDFKVYGLLLLFFLAFVTSIAILKSKMEAITFNKFSDKKITTWDALWADFRILSN